MKQHKNNLWSHYFKDKHQGRSAYICTTFEGTLDDHISLAIGYEPTIRLAEQFLRRNIALQMIHTGLRYPDMAERLALKEQEETELSPPKA
jgi:hypothetical protein